MEARVEQMEKILKDRDMEVLFARVASNLLNKGNAEEAIRICESGIKRYPMYAQGHFVMANCYDSKEMQDEARNEYERVVKYDPNHLAALKKLADLYNTAGRSDLYKEKIKVLATLDPMDESIIQTAQSLGIYEEINIIDETATEKSESAGDETPDSSDPLEVDKLDLSQFDNQDDDFTTIIQGKPEEEDEEKEEEEEKITLGVGAAAAELNADTEVNHRLVYEEELRIRKKPSDSESESGEEYEDLDELQFDKSEKEDQQPEESHEDWAMTVGDNDATEIILNKKSADNETKVKPAKKKSENKDENKKTDSEEYQQPKIVTQTLGEILVSQKKYVEALRVFETLQEQHPENKNIVKKVAFLKKIIALEQK